MVWTIARRQLLEYLVTWRFGLVLAVSTVLVVLATMLQVDSLEQELADFDARQNQAQQQVQEARTYNELRLPVGRRPPTLAFLCAGQDRELPHFATAGILAPPVEPLGLSLSGEFWYIGYGEVRPSETVSLRNPLMEGLSSQRIDFAFVVGTFLSLLAFLLSFDSIAGERETGTLPVVLANAVSRGTVLLGKW
ncbi:MAG: ABC transporter permease subunit, partial [Candidatus Latescibacterota bacterium]